MGTLTLSMMMTLDAYIAGPKNELDWVTWEEEMDRDASKLIEKSDALLVGYGAYKDMAHYWPAALTKPSSESEGDFAKLINSKHKIVVSDTANDLLWTDEELLVVDDLKGQIEKLKARHTTIVAYGGVTLAQFLVREGLVDNVELIISPVALGKGRSLFKNLDAPQTMQDVIVKPYASGALRLHGSLKK